MDGNFSNLLGDWKLSPDESEPIDDIMSKLGIGWLRRKALRYFSAITEIYVEPSDCKSSSTDPSFVPTYEMCEHPLKIFMATHFPYGYTKSGKISIDGQSFQYSVSGGQRFVLQMILGCGHRDLDLDCDFPRRPSSPETIQRPMGRNVRREGGFLV